MPVISARGPSAIGGGGYRQCSARGGGLQPPQDGPLGGQVLAASPPGHGVQRAGAPLKAGRRDRLRGPPTFADEAHDVPTREPPKMSGVSMPGGLIAECPGEEK